ncbi:uncharacterized protein LOC136091960 [Hydra vulgaris]|uniref:Uncharacterized protein LOC136091960 n=1 Tax=Hydra vulgaris TaxID=6087 RepID=A0ABM4DMF9_HYDVU
MSTHCAVKGCSNGQYKLIKWNEAICEEHGVCRDDPKCSCEAPFRLHTFPTKKKELDRRNVWKLLINRENNKKVWSPGAKSRVCSQHFLNKSSIDYPTLNLGYDASQRIQRLVPIDSLSYSCKRKMPFKSIDFNKIENIYEIPEGVTLLPESNQNEPAQKKVNYDSEILHKLNVDTITVKNNGNIDSFLTENNKKLTNKNKLLNELSNKNKLLDELVNKNKLLLENNKILRRKLAKYESQKFYRKILDTDENVLFYTGIQNKEIFNAIHNIVFPVIRRKWNGSYTKSIINRKFKKFPNKLGAKTKLCTKDEMLLTLMKIRLALTEKDLSHRFNISVSLASRIFVTWVKGLASVLHHLIFIPDKGALNFTRPKRFDHIKDIHSIIDATELFIETPKNPDLQKLTWSEYKHHNTIKVLVSITPNSFINFVSSSYPGSISDKKLTIDSQFLDLVPQFSYVMADKGFNIQSECLTRNITLYVPPGKRGLYQMLPSEIKKTKQIANLRILVEQVIRQLKTFKILANELPIKLISSIDDIVLICSALCNLLPPIFAD